MLIALLVKAVKVLSIALQIAAELIKVAVLVRDTYLEAKAAICETTVVNVVEEKVKSTTQPFSYGQTAVAGVVEASEVTGACAGYGFA